MLLSIVVTLIVVILLAYLACWAIDLLVGSIPPSPSPGALPIATLLKLLVVIVVIVVLCEAIWGSHHLLIRVGAF